MVLAVDEEEDAPKVLNRWVRGVLVMIAVGLSAIFAIALWLNPYDEEGNPRRMETHRQMGLPPCTFYSNTGLPCPSCGMTTSFALLMHGDVLNSLRANSVGTLLALLWLALIPWSLASAVKKRIVLVRSVERTVMILVIGFLALMIVRWVVLLILTLSGGTTARF
jgi:hypothetical protein